MPIVLKSGSLNLLEPSGPDQACNGIALPLFSVSIVLCVWAFLFTPHLERAVTDVMRLDMDELLVPNRFLKKRHLLHVIRASEFSHSSSGGKFPRR